MTYDLKRLQGVSAYQEIGRDFAKGNRIQFTAPSRDLGVANRDLATIEKIHDGTVTARLDGEGPSGKFPRTGHAAFRSWLCRDLA